MIIESKCVLLLKGQKDDENDKYEQLLTEHGFTVKYLQVLDFQFINLSVLYNKLVNVNEYDGIVFTSSRAVIATKLCLTENKITLNENWRNKLNYVVGETTYEVANKELNLNCKGKESGNANNLANVIIEDKPTKLLFPCGNLKKETLRTRLQEHNILLDATTVYETIQNENLNNEFVKLTSNFTSVPEYFVYFSPSGVKFTSKILKEANIALHQIKFVAIGPSTEQALKTENFQISAVSNQPTPEQLMKTILST